MSHSRIYLAGPEVFRADAVAEGARLKAICTGYEIDGLFPLDAAPGHAPVDAATIRANCIALLETADAVVANISPFRGEHMDPGTAWEIGYAEARGIPVYVWSRERLPLIDRVGWLKDAGPGGKPRCRDGYEVEDFDRTENLMILPDGRWVYPDAETAIDWAARHLTRHVDDRVLHLRARIMVIGAFALALAAAIAGGYVAAWYAGW